MSRTIAYTAICAFVIASLTLTLAGAYTALDKEGLDSKDAPAWVQAFGSIAAIVAGALAVRYQIIQTRKDNVKDRAQEKKDISLACLLLAEEAHKIIRHYVNRYENHPAGQRFDATLDQFEDLQSGFRSLLAADIPVILYKPMLGMQAATSLALASVRKRQGKVKTFSEEELRNANWRLSKAERHITEISALVFN